MSTVPETLSTAEASERLGISREHVRRLIQQEVLRAEQTVDGFKVDADDVARLAAERRVRKVKRDEREFRLAINDLATKARRVEGADAFGEAVASLREGMKMHSTIELPKIVAPQVARLNEMITVNPAFAGLEGSVKDVTERWQHMTVDTHHAIGMVLDYASRLGPDGAESIAGIKPDMMKSMRDILGPHESPLKQALDNLAATGLRADHLNLDAFSKAMVADTMKATLDEITAMVPKVGNFNLGPTGVEALTGSVKQQVDRVGTAAFGADTIPIPSLSQHWDDIQKVTWQQQMDHLTRMTASLAAPTVSGEEMARGFVVPESRETQLERKVEQLTEKIELLAAKVDQLYAVLVPPVSPEG